MHSRIENISDAYASFNLPKSTRPCTPTIKDLRNEEVLIEKNAKVERINKYESKMIDTENEVSSHRSGNMFNHTIFSADDTSDSSDISSSGTEDEIESDSDNDDDLENN